VTAGVALESAVAEIAVVAAHNSGGVRNSPDY